MPAIFDFLYQEYCRARLAEMRKQLLLRSPESAGVLDIDCADRDSLTDDSTASPSEARFQ